MSASAAGAAALNLAFLVGFVWIFVARQWFYSVSPAMVAIFCLPLVAAVLTGRSLTMAFREPAGRPAARVARALIAATLVLFPLFLWRWNLLGFYF